MSRFACQANLLGLVVLLGQVPAASAQFRPRLVPFPVVIRPRPFIGASTNFFVVPPRSAGWGAAASLQGMANLTQAQGQYWMDIQQARLMREQSRQASIETRRQQLQWELEYEQFRDTAPRMLARQQAVDIDWARNHAQSTEIWSGRTLNVLLRSILRSPNPTQGPYITLTKEQLRGLNLTDGTTRANLTMTKNQGKIAWPEAFQAESFDELRSSFSKTFKVATKSIESGQQPTVQTLRSLRTDLDNLDGKLVTQVNDLAPSRFIEARRLVNQLRETVRGMSDPRLVKSNRNDWRQGIHTVADLVNHMKTNGLEFAPAAAPGDHASYTAVYYALRQYERSVI